MHIYLFFLSIHIKKHDFIIIPPIPVQYCRGYSCFTLSMFARAQRTLDGASVGGDGTAWYDNFSSHRSFICVLHDCVSIQFCTFKIFLRLSVLAVDYFEACCFIFKRSEIFLLSFYFYFLGGFHCGENILSMISVLLDVLRFILWPRVWPRFILGARKDVVFHFYWVKWGVCMCARVCVNQLYTVYMFF